MDQVYSDLYDMVNNVMKEHGRQMASTKETFMSILHAETSVLDGIEVDHLDNLSFLETAYVVLMKRLPDREAMEHWGYYAGIYPPERFRKELLEVLLDSKECISKGGILVHNVILPDRAKGIMEWKSLDIMEEAADQQGARKEGFKDKVYKLYLKLPMKMRAGIRKVLGRG